MKVYEIITENEETVKKLGRAFNHLEDLVFFYGSAGTLEALNHIREMATEEGAKTIRMKWDGSPQIYWGRERKNGPLILAGHNGWGRKVKTDNPVDLEDFIANRSGKPKTAEDKLKRDAFAKQFASLYPLFDRATPKDFVGFVYADALFLNRPSMDAEGVYNFAPNPKSQTVYHVLADSPLGQRISNARVMVVGHGYFPTFGMPDEEQKPMDNFRLFNTTPELIVQGPIYNSTPIAIDTTAIDEVQSFVTQNAAQIDTFLQGTVGLADLKNIIYNYVNTKSKAGQLDQLSAADFLSWVSAGTSKISTNKQEKINELAKKYPNALDSIFTLVAMIMSLKNEIIDQAEQTRAEVWDTQGEGRVRYADPSKQFGNIKLVPRHRWVPK